MLIDWITARLPERFFDRHEWYHLMSLTDRVSRYCGKTGELRWESAAWESVRSDSHQIAFRVGSDAIWIQGSPARLMGEGDTVFGLGASAALDLTGCVERMSAFVFDQVGLPLRGHPWDWIVSRIDVTGNLLLNSLVDVREALRILRNVEGGRYRVSQKAGDTVYWSTNSRLRKGKAYAKGPHLEYQMRKKGYDGKRYVTEEICLANRLLRLELTLGAQWLREERSGKKWHELTNGDLYEEWESYFSRMVGDMETTNDRELKEKIYLVAPTAGQAKAAYGTWALIQSQGWEQARDMHSSRTWYRNLKILRNAGLSDADLSAGRIVEFRRQLIECQLVESWEELRKVA